MKPAKPTSNPLERLGPTVASLGLRRKAFPLEPGSAIAGVVIRELSGFDDDEISKAVVLPAETSMIHATKVLRREALRRAIVAIWPLGGPPGAEATEVSQPFDGLDKYPSKTLRQLQEFFDVMNGIDEDELKKAAAAAIEWEPGDGVPPWPGAAASVPPTGSESPKNA